mgnify:FL=1
MIVLFLIAAGISWVVTSGIIWLICWLIGWDFSIKVATAIWLVMMLIYGSFSK